MLGKGGRVVGGGGSLLDSLSNEFQAHLGTKGGKHCIYVVHVDHHNVRQCRS